MSLCIKDNMDTLINKALYSKCVVQLKPLSDDDISQYKLSLKGCQLKSKTSLPQTSKRRPKKAAKRRTGKAAKKPPRKTSKKAAKRHPRKAAKMTIDAVSVTSKTTATVNLPTLVNSSIVQAVRHVVRTRSSTASILNRTSTSTTTIKKTESDITLIDGKLPTISNKIRMCNTKWCKSVGIIKCKCSLVYYCSTKCQLMDKLDSHRDICD